VGRTVEWSVGTDPDLLVEIWSTAALMEAVIGALLDEPEKLQLALRALGASNSTEASDQGGTAG